jgi:hypothetical protein
MKNYIIKLLGGYTKKDIGKYNAIILNEFQKQGTPEMPIIAYDERVCLIPAINKALELLTPTEHSS